MMGSRGPCSTLAPEILAILDGLAAQEAARAHATPAAPASDGSWQMRLQNLEQGGAKSSITAEDVRWIVRGGLADTLALTAVRHWIDCAFHGKPTRNGKPCPAFLLLHGPRGIGKTVAGAWAIANEIGYYVTAGEYRRQRYSYSPLDVERRQRAQTGKLVVLDDLGYESLMPERDEEWLLEFVNHRQGAGYFTIVTTNEAPERWFEQRYGNRVFEKLQHQGALVPLVGMNLRRRWNESG